MRSFLIPRSPIRFPGEIDDVEEVDGMGKGTVAGVLPPRFLRRPCKANGIPDLRANICKLQLRNKTMAKSFRYAPYGKHIVPTAGMFENVSGRGGRR